MRVLPTPADMPGWMRDRSRITHNFPDGEDTERHSFDRCRCGAKMVQRFPCGGDCGCGGGYRWFVQHRALPAEEVPT